MHRCGDGISLKFKMKGERKRMIVCTYCRICMMPTKGMTPLVKKEFKMKREIAKC